LTPNEDIEFLQEFFKAEQVRIFSESFYTVVCKNPHYQFIFSADIIQKLENKKLRLYAVFSSDNKLHFDIMKLEGLTS